jgi:LacI family transcriptional regulator
MSDRRSPGTRGTPQVATLRAVAEAAGCSTATVSKALNGLPVSAENLERVFAAAEALGYVPNSAARSIRGQPTMTIGIVMDVDVHPQLELMAVLDTMIGDLEREGYSVFVSVARGDGGDSADVLLRRFVERRIDGLFYWNPRPAKSLAWYRRAGIPVLAIGFRDKECADLPLVTVDGGPVYRQAFKRLKALGHRVVGDVADPQAAAARVVSAKASGLRYRRLELGHDRASVAAFVSSLADDANAPTAIVAPYPNALQFLSVCEEHGLGVPDRLSLVSATDSDGAALLRTPLSVIRTDYQKVGRAAADAMLAALGGATLSDVTVPDSIQWIERASIGPAPG